MRNTRFGRAQRLATPRPVPPVPQAPAARSYRASTPRTPLAAALLALAVLAAAAMTACDRDAPLAPPDATPPDAAPAPGASNRALGLVEVTITGIGSGHPSAAAVPYRPGMPGALAGRVGAGGNADLYPVFRNTALRFDGEGDYVRADLVTGDVIIGMALTLEAWVHPEAESGGQQAVLSFHTSTGENVMMLLYEPDRDGFAYYDDAIGYVRTPGPQTYGPGRWVHVAVAIDASGQGTLYVDGTLQASFTTPTSLEPGGRFSIGQEYDVGGPSDFFFGRIDEVRVWSVARTAAGIQTDMDQVLDPDTPGLFAYFRFSEILGTAVAEIARGNDGVLEGDPTWRAAGPALEGEENGTIQLDPVLTGTVTEGERGAGGVRYIHAAFRVRNAQQDGTPYDLPLENLTFLAVDTDGTHGRTAVSRLVTFGGTEITGTEAVAIAERVVPTGAAYRRSDGALRSIEPDVLQLLTEAEAAEVDLTGTAATDVFPYGFVVRTPGVTPGSRMLPASPDPDQFDGLVTFAFKVPLQASAAEDPFEISAVFLPVDDTETRLTQSFEEQTPEALAAFEARAAELGAAEVRLLPGGDYDGAIPLRMLCEPARVAGAEGAATTVLFPDLPAFQSLSPDPYATDGSASRISGTPSFSATFDGPVGAVDATTFVVHGSQSGAAFLGAPYTGGGTATITTPMGSFSAGERVEVTLTPALGFCPDRYGRVARYRVAAGAASATFTPSTMHLFSGKRWVSIATGDLDGDGTLDLAVVDENDGDAVVLMNGDADPYPSGGPHPVGIAAADLDNDGDLDLAVADSSDGRVSVLLNDGAANFGGATRYDAGAGANSITSGDFDGDGDLDLAVANGLDDDIAVLLNAGDATLAPAVRIPAGDRPASIAAADLNGDGALDLVVANGDPNIISVLLNRGDADFDGAVGYAVPRSPHSVAAADFDGDGDLDLAVPNGDFGDEAQDNVAVLPNLGDGTFGTGVQHDAGASPTAITTGDLDGDGDLDIAVSNEEDGVSVLLNAGNATFGHSAMVLLFSELHAIASGDLDGDLDLDLFVGGSQAVIQLLNN